MPGIGDDTYRRLEERLARLESVEAARSLLARYARACDAQDIGTIGGMLAADCELEVSGSSWKGVSEVTAFFRQAWTEDPSRKSHFICNVRPLSVERGVITVDAYFLYTAAGDHSSVLGWGEYLDVVDTSGPQPVFKKKAMSLTRAADVRQGWALGSEQAAGARQ